MSRILFAYIIQINKFLFTVDLTCYNFAIRVSCFFVEFVISINLAGFLLKNKIEYLSYKKKNELYFNVMCIFSLVANKA